MLVAGKQDLKPYDLRVIEPDELPDLLNPRSCNVCLLKY